MVGRILLEYFKSAVESNSELNVDEVFNTVNQIVSDPGIIIYLIDILLINLIYLFNS